MNVEQKKPFRILSLDGGGIRGVISARILAEVEKHCGQPIVEYFDMIAGTSTGSLIAAGLAVGYTPEDLVNLYLEKGATIFPYQSLTSPSRWKLIVKYGPSAPKFSNEGLVKVITEELPKFKKGDGFVTLREAGRDSPDQEVPKPILILPAYDTRYRNTTVFTNYRPLPGEKKKWYLEQPLWKICVSSAAAPTFFPPLELTNVEANGQKWSYPHVDGGVTANNPALCAIARAIALGHKLEDIQLLSIGTGRNVKPLAFKDIEGWGLVQWGMRISDVFMEGQAELQDSVCESLLGGKESIRYLRLQFNLNEVYGASPDYLGEAPILPDKQRWNAWLKRHLSESMDDARPESVKSLVEATDKYLESGNLFENRFNHYGPVKENIKQFFSADACSTKRTCMAKSHS